MIERGWQMPGVFITYSADGRRWAEKLAAALKAEGIETWTDLEKLSPGQNLQEQVEQALEATDIYLYVLGSRPHRDPAQDRQWQRALERSWTDPSKRIIPVLIGRAEAPPFLQAWQPFRIDPKEKASDAVKRLVEILKAPPASLRRRVTPGREWLERLRLIEQVAKQWKAQESLAVKPKP